MAAQLSRRAQWLMDGAVSCVAAEDGRASTLRIAQECEATGQDFDQAWKWHAEGYKVAYREERDLACRRDVAKAGA